MGTPRSVSPFRPLTAPGAHWPPRPRADIAVPWAGYLELRRSEWRDPDLLAQQQLRQGRALIAHAMRYVPYYRAVFTGHGVVAEDVRTMDDFRRLPILTRRTYQEQFTEMVAERLPPGTSHTGAVHTSGTSGLPIEVHLTDVVEVWWFAFHLRDVEWCAIDPHEAMAVIRPTNQPANIRDFLLGGVSLPTWPGLDGLVETGPLHLMDINQDPRLQLEWLCGVAPSSLVTHPSNLDALAGHALEQGQRIPNLRAIHTLSEGLTDHVRRRAEAAFGARVTNTYSSNEAGYLASPCPEGKGLHVHAENVVLEVLDDADRPCAPGKVGRVVLTALHNFATPLIRYDIMDEAEVGPARCDCGRGLPLLSRVSGKRHLMLELPNGSRRSSADLVSALHTVGGCHQFQVVVRARDSVLIRIVPNRSWTRDHVEQIRQAVGEHLDPTLEVDVIELDRLPLPASGKLMDIVLDGP